MLLLSRLVAGGLGATLNVSQAYVADQTPPEQRTRVMGLVALHSASGSSSDPRSAVLLRCSATRYRDWWRRASR
jgi:MFS family permease